MASRQWVPLPIDSKLYLNSDEALLGRANAKLENAYQNDAGGFSRFPGLTPWLQLPDKGRVHGFAEWRGDLMAGTSKGRLYRISEGADAEDVTALPIPGGGRIIFDKTDDELIAAAGGPLIRFAGQKTEVLSEDAPLSTHVGTIDSYVVATEKGSQRFNHSNAGAARTWDPLDVFSADSRPGPLTAMLVTPFRELIFAGPDSIEQWERSSSGDVPFFRRWAVGEGLKAPYAIAFADNAVFCINRRSKFVRFSGQTSQPAGDDIAALLDAVDDWSEAWIGGGVDNPLNWNGQSFLVLQIPNATNGYGTKGITALYDIRKQRFSLLYGWDDRAACPTRWPGWAHFPMWDQTFVGGDDGWIYKLDGAVHTNGGSVQRFLARTGHWDEGGECVIDDLRVRIKRGVGSNTTASSILVRVNRDNQGFGPWVTGSLGYAGQREMLIRFGGFGISYTRQFEIQCTDDAPVELVKAEALLTPTGN
jgi:hypothetical protein